MSTLVTVLYRIVLFSVGVLIGLALLRMAMSDDSILTLAGWAGIAAAVAIMLHELADEVRQ